MRRERYEELAECVRSYVFHLLDDDVDFTGDEAGDVAHRVEQEFKAATSDWLNEFQFKPEHALKLVADSPERLRTIDLDRLLSDYWDHRDALVAWLKEQRPDIVQRIDWSVAAIQEEHDEAERLGKSGVDDPEWSRQQWLHNPAN